MHKVQIVYSINIKKIWLIVFSFIWLINVKYKQQLHTMWHV